MVHRVEHRPHKHARQTELPLPQLINDCGPLHVIIDSRFRPPSRPVVVIQSFWTTSGLLVEQSGHVFLLVYIQADHKRNLNVVKQSRHCDPRNAE
jgi:hypothetical protein